MKALWSLLLVVVVGCAGQAVEPERMPAGDSRAMAAKPSKPADAEYAVRWNVAAGGPKSAEKVLEALGLEPKKDKETGKLKEKKLTVEYFDVKEPEPPAGFTTILRRRTDAKKESELTFKFRGDEAIEPPACPLEGADKQKSEVDVTFLGASDMRPAYSYSCDEKTQELPAKLRPKFVGCTGTMRRLEAKFASDELKVEEWAIKKARYIEVSFGAKYDDAGAQSFGEQVVAPLLKKGIHPLKEGMTTITTSCAGKKTKK